MVLALGLLPAGCAADTTSAGDVKAIVVDADEDFAWKALPDGRPGPDAGPHARTADGALTIR